MKNYHPCSKEFQEDAKKLGLTGSQHTQKLREEGIIKSISKVDNEWVKNGIHAPLSEDELDQ